MGWPVTAVSSIALLNIPKISWSNRLVTVQYGRYAASFSHLKTDCRDDRKDAKISRKCTSAMKHFENVQRPQDKSDLLQTCTNYCRIVALSIAYLVGFLKKSCEELLWKNAEPDSLSLRYFCAFQPPRDGSAGLCLNWSGCWLSFRNEFGSPC